MGIQLVKTHLSISQNDEWVNGKAQIFSPFPLKIKTNQLISLFHCHIIISFYFSKQDQRVGYSTKLKLKTPWLKIQEPVDFLYNSRHPWVMICYEGKSLHNFIQHIKSLIFFLLTKSRISQSLILILWFKIIMLLLVSHVEITIIFVNWH